MSEENKISNQLKNLADAIVDNISNTSDKEILEEVREEYNDPEFEANIIRDIIKEVKAKKNKERFLKAKSELDAFKKGNTTTPMNQEPLQGFSEADLDNFTMAARDGKKISEKDRAGILEDWEDLKKMKSQNKKEEK